MTQLVARHYRTHETVSLDTLTGRWSPISAVARDLPWVAPALFDLQINGCDGISFNSPDLTEEQVHHVVQVCRSHGIGGLLPTLVTNSFEAIQHGFSTLRQACEKDPFIAKAIPGFHLEGPYIGMEDGPRGAHPRKHVRPPDWEEFSRWQDSAGGKIKLVTLAPEYPEAPAFIEKLTESGVVVAIGHTAANREQIREAIRAGAKLSTHLGNGCHAVLPRHENCIWEQLAADELWASFIPDGHHLPASVVKSIVRCKTPSRCIITCDASSLAGLPPGKYAQWGTELEVLPKGKVVVPGTPFLAGSGVFTDQCIAEVLRMTDLGLAEAIDLATTQPRKLLSLPESEATICFDWSEGSDFVVRGIFS